MTDIAAGFAAAFQLLLSFDARLWEIIALSLEVNLAAVFLSCRIGLPLGGALAVYRFRGRKALIILINALMGLPPVVVGLMIYLMLSRSGPLGSLNILFTPGAMIIAQAILVTPIVTALTRQITEALWLDYREQLTSLGSSRMRAIPTLLWDGRAALFTAVLAGFGRAAAEVGAVIIVGGNIAHHTRTMTTAIALETGRGNLALALGLGIVLVTLAILLNTAAWMVRERSMPEAALLGVDR